MNALYHTARIRRRTEGTLPTLSRCRPMRETLGKALFFVLAVPVVLRAALRLAWLNRRCDLDQLADQLRAVRPWRGSYLAHPRYLRGSAQRLLSWLPPRGFGPCLKHSFLLLDLWSRCGLEPKIHIGTLKNGEEHHFHAWVTLPETREPHLDAGEYAELWSR